MKCLKFVVAFLALGIWTGLQSQNWTCPECNQEFSGNVPVRHLCSPSGDTPCISQGSLALGEGAGPVYTSLITTVHQPASDDQDELLSLNLSSLTLSEGTAASENVYSALSQLHENALMYSHITNFANNLDNPDFTASLAFFQGLFAWGSQLSGWGTSEETLLEQVFAPGMGELLSALTTQENIQTALQMIHQHPGLLESLNVLHRLWKSLTEKLHGFAQRVTWSRAVIAWLKFLESHPAILARAEQSPLAIVLALVASTENMKQELTQLLDPERASDNFKYRRSNYSTLARRLDRHFQNEWGIPAENAAYITNHLLHLMRRHISLTSLLGGSQQAIRISGDEHYLPRGHSHTLLSTVLPDLDEQTTVDGFLYLLHHPEDLETVYKEYIKSGYIITVLQSKLGSQPKKPDSIAGP